VAVRVTQTRSGTQMQAGVASVVCWAPLSCAAADAAAAAVWL